MERRRAPWGLLLAAFLLMPLAEIFVLVQVGQVIGAWWTILLLLLDSLVGLWLVRREGTRAWDGLREAVGSGRVPGRELADAALVLVGATLLLTPGFLTDALGVFCVLPFTRPLARALLVRVVGQRVSLQTTVTGPRGGATYGGGPRRPPPAGAGWPPGAGAAPGRGDVVQGEVVDRDDDEPPATR